MVNRWWITLMIHFPFVCTLNIYLLEKKDDTIVIIWAPLIVHNVRRGQFDRRGHNLTGISDKCHHNVCNSHQQVSGPWHSLICVQLSDLIYRGIILKLNSGASKQELAGSRTYNRMYLSTLTDDVSFIHALIQAITGSTYCNWDEILHYE